MKSVKLQYTNPNTSKSTYAAAYQLDDGKADHIGVGAIEELEGEVIYRFPFTYASGLAPTIDQTFTSIQAGELPYEVRLQVEEAFVGGTSVAIGTKLRDGTDAQAAQLFTATEGATANLVLGAMVKSTATFVGGSVPFATERMPYTVFVGTFTAGKATLIIHCRRTTKEFA